MRRTIAEYELEEHINRGERIYGARHETYAPFACNSPLKLHVEDSHIRPGEMIVSERCQCGKVVQVWRVLHEAVLLSNDVDDDCA